MSAQQCYQYSFIAFICLGLLIQNYINILHYGNRTIDGKYFRYFILASIACTALSVIYGLREAHLIGYNSIFAYSEEILYSVISIFATYFWFITSESYQQSKLVATRKRRILISIPFVIISIITAFTPLHHLNFYFEDAHYVRGPLVVVISVFFSAFVVGTGVSALVKSFLKKFYLERSFFLIIFLYAVILVTFQATQVVFESVLPFQSMGVALVIYIIQQKFIKGNIYTDCLTGANNRNCAERYIHNNLKDLSSNIHVALIDADNFKSINDTYGHHAGDMALQLLAKAFMKNLGDSCFFARYGGDEFILIDKSKDCSEIESIVEKARASILEMCKEENTDFNLDFSCGIVQKTSEMETIPDIISAADSEMYKIKSNKKAGRR